MVFDRITGREKDPRAYEKLMIAKAESISQSFTPSSANPQTNLPAGLNKSNKMNIAESVKSIAREDEGIVDTTPFEERMIQVKQLNEEVAFEDAESDLQSAYVMMDIEEAARDLERIKMMSSQEHQPDNEGKNQGKQDLKKKKESQNESVSKEGKVSDDKIKKARAESDEITTMSTTSVTSSSGTTTTYDKIAARVNEIESTQKVIIEKLEQLNSDYSEVQQTVHTLSDDIRQSAGEIKTYLTNHETVIKTEIMKMKVTSSIHEDLASIKTMVENIVCHLKIKVGIPFEMVHTDETNLQSTVSMQDITNEGNMCKKTKGGRPAWK